MNEELPTRQKKFSRFPEFYAFYLRQHSDRRTRRMHFCGISLALLCLVVLAGTRNPAWFLAALLCGYGFAWIGHLVYEKNTPTSFRQPFYSFLGDWRLWFEMLTGKIPF